MQVPDEDVAMRRWIAARLARAAASLDAARSVAELGLPLDMPAPPEWSGDAHAAATALCMEQATFGPTGNDVPGFRGPDAWYGAPLR